MMMAAPPRENSPTRAGAPEPHAGASISDGGRGRGPVHAHWNFDRGATWGSILSACRRAVTTVMVDGGASSDRADREEGGGALSDLSKFQEEIFGISSPSPGALDPDAIDPAAVLARIDGYDGVGRPDDTASDAATARMQSAALEALRLLGITADETEAEADGGKRGAWDREAASAVFGLMSILFCLDRLGVRSASYAPLPVASDAAGTASETKNVGGAARSVPIQRMAGLNVIPVSGGAVSPAYDASSIALLKLPLDGARRRVSGSDPPAMTLLGQYVGVEETNSSSPGVRVTLTLGTLLPAEHTTVREPFHHEVSSTLLTTATSSPSPPTVLPWNTDRAVLLETNVDDTTAEHLQFVLELVTEHPGALDAWTAPIGMKKGRAAAATLLTVLCTEESQEELLLLLFRHSTTLGVRRRTVDRATLRRRVVTVETDWTCRRDDGAGPIHGRVSVKVAYLLVDNRDSSESEEEIVSIKPEFDHCREISLATGIPIQSIADQALQLAKQQLALNLSSS